MKVFILSLSLFILCFVHEARSQTISGEERKTYEVLIDSFEFYDLKSPQRSLQFATTILSGLPVKGNEDLHIEALLHGANSLKMLSKNAEALDYASKAIPLSNQIANLELRVRSYYMKGTIFSHMGIQDYTLIYLQHVIDLHRPGINPYYVSSAYTGIGSIYKNLDNVKKAEEYYLKGYQMSSGNYNARLYTLSDLISFYASRRNPKYLPYLDTLASSDFFKKASPTSFMVHFNSFLLLDKASDDEKEKTLREVYAYGLTHNAPIIQVGYGMKLYEFLSKKHKYGEAQTLLVELLQKGLESKNGVRLTGVLNALYENSKALGKVKDALNYLEQLSDLRDSLLSEENAGRIAELNVKFETAQKDHEIEQQKIRLIQERHDRNLFILLAILVAALALAVFIYFRNRTRSAQRIAKQENIIHLQKTEQLRKEKELAELTATMESQENERNRIARDLHDGLGSLMSGISSQIEYLRARTADEHPSHSFLSQLREMVKDATAELRRTSYELMPAKLLRQGLEPAVRDLCMNQLYKNKIETTLEVNADLNILSPEQQLTVYRMIQELLTNIVKHADAKNVLIQFNNHEHEMSVIVEDDGQGFDVASKKIEGGLGLGSLQSRTNLLKGFLDIASTPGAGTTVTINFNVN